MANSALTQEVSLYSLVLFVAAFFWTVGYDSIYGILDYEYDKKIKVKSSVVKFGQYTDVFCCILLWNVFIIDGIFRIFNQCRNIVLWNIIACYFTYVLAN
jgi:4-hydroxybenzoate polyprenyltransferase